MPKRSSLRPSQLSRTHHLDKLLDMLTPGSHDLFVNLFVVKELDAAFYNKVGFPSEGL
jgi:hypothetical protein